MMCVQEMLDYGKQRLLESGIENAANESVYFMESLLHVNRTWIFLHGKARMKEADVIQYKEWIDMRCTHYPMQYILGEQPFMDFTFYVNEHVLIPRQDTEILVEQAIKRLKPGRNVLDICCGSGCIGLSLAKLSGVYVTLSDISGEAMEVVRENVKRLGLQSTDKVNLVCSDLFDCIEGRFDMIISNPPYIKSNVIPTLMQEVRDYEPVLALDGGRDGLNFYKRIINEAGSYLNENGYLCFEIGYDQGQDLRQIFVDACYSDIEIVKDLAGLDRVAIGRKG